MYLNTAACIMEYKKKIIVWFLLHKNKYMLCVNI